MTNPYDQGKYQVRFEWGLAGARSVLDDVDVVVVVDVLSFSTTVDVALSHGVTVLPAAPEDAAALAAAHGARLAGGRGEELSLAPSSYGPEHAGARVVVASPNGSAISAALGGGAVEVVAASLRNRRAVAEWVLARQEAKADRFRVAVVAAGERWPDGSTRVAVEDLFGAGAIIDALADLGIDHTSPEAAAAGASFAGLRNAVKHLVSASASARELVDAGFADDVRLAAQLDVSTLVPVLRESSFTA
ncbi:2-phosphosulfolactate phosphatase [Diaminobutyricimonas aerilata]|uniref:2-phosphosulfolactate phosphatase n=1 Tax=Diaminobutyricimonas aerilata TaxID=1162967 RepID=UPI001B808B69|nr:2-phosphosulfolactate phosphatase [Diaminobutyricimonas aerilata]